MAERLHDGVHQSAGNAAQDIEQQKAHMTEGILHVVGKDPEEGHVEKQVQPAAVQEHVGDERHGFRHRLQ